MAGQNGWTPIPGVYKPSARHMQAFSICIYGPSGSGKTTLLGTMPGRGLVIDVPQIEGGNFVLSHVADRIDIKDINDWDEIDGVYKILRANNHGYDWVAIDSITAFSELARRKVTRSREPSLTNDPHSVTQPEWGRIGNQVGELIYQFKLLNIHTIWTAQERMHGGRDTGEPAMMGPDVSPATLKKLKPPLLLLGRLTEEHNGESYERRLRIGPSERYYTKYRAERIGLRVPHVIRNPDLRSILKYLLGTGAPPEEVEETSLVLTLS